MPVDLIGRLNRRVAQPEHDVLQAFVLPADHPEGDRVAEGMQCDVFRITPSAPGNIMGMNRIIATTDTVYDSIETETMIGRPLVTVEEFLRRKAEM